MLRRRYPEPEPRHRRNRTRPRWGIHTTQEGRLQDVCRGKASFLHLSLLAYYYNNTNNLKGAPSFDRVINVVVGDASAAAINRIHELGGSIRTRSLPKKEEAVNQKLTRPSKDERQNPKIENQGAVGHQATSTADEDLSDESPHEGGVRLGSV